MISLFLNHLYCNLWKQFCKIYGFQNCHFIKEVGKVPTFLACRCIAILGFGMNWSWRLSRKVFSDSNSLKSSRPCDNPQVDFCISAHPKAWPFACKEGWFLGFSEVQNFHRVSTLYTTCSGLNVKVNKYAYYVTYTV